MSGMVHAYLSTVYTYVCMCTYIYGLYGQASGRPGPPPNGMSGRVGGGWRVRRVVWPVGWGAAVGAMGHRDLTQALRKP